MTLLNILFLLGFIVVMYMMMKKGGGCCGGHSHEGHGPPDNNQKESHDHHTELENAGGGSNIDPVCGMTVDGEGCLVLSGPEVNEQLCQKAFAILTNLLP